MSTDPFTPVMLDAIDGEPVVWVARTGDNRFLGVFASESEAVSGEHVEQAEGDGSRVLVDPVVIYAPPTPWLPTGPAPTAGQEQGPC